MIVTFNPEIATLRKMIEALQAQVEEIVLVDNASAATGAEQIAQLAHEYACRFESLTENLGIGAAQNWGFAAVTRRESNSSAGDRYVLFLDHDSIPETSMVDLLLAADLRMRDQGVRVGAVGPAIVDNRTGTTGRFVSSSNLFVKRIPCQPGCAQLDVDFLISSGTLVRVDTFEEIGGMDEALFIDHVDTEWCLRAKAAGYALFGVCNARLIHSLGDEVVAVWVGRKREIFVHSPLRDYYMCRNTLLILRSAHMSFGWRLFLSMRLVASIVFFVATQAPRLRRLRCMMVGLRDGLLNRQGKWKPSW
ncbi:rhamnosyltransferase [Paraburkholderia sediminicola]|uniref:rhamnosyltransferase n=1 Tax=Paraburkholderia domus TaxID=2793075 RepID=UPI001B8BE212|nr:rhamnosyltransferase [Paraburkholderia domus]MCI0145633.1 rhamnosyltransferase [Paraburkholderia sediminicola]